MTRTVVLAVNDPNIRYLLQRYVEESGLQAVFSGRDGGVAETAARSGAALIIMEAGAPGATANGGKSLQSLRARPETRRTPVLLYGPHGRPADGAAGEEGQDAATGHLQEYVMYDQFLAALRRVGVRVQAGAHPRALKAEEARL